MSKKNEKAVEMDKMISVKLPAELLEKARQKSGETGVSLSFVVRKAVEAWTEDVPAKDKNLNQP
jgi:predicted DNA-binding protein